MVFPYGKVCRAKSILVVACNVGPCGLVFCRYILFVGVWVPFCLVILMIVVRFGIFLE